MQKTITALAAAAVLALSACAIPAPAQPAYQPPPAPIVSEARPISEPEPQPAAAPAYDAEEAFLDDIAAGFVIHDLPRQPGAETSGLRESTLTAAYSTCDVLAAGDSGFEMALLVAEQSLSDRSTFEAAMPLLFVMAAEEHLC